MLDNPWLVSPPDYRMFCIAVAQRYVPPAQGFAQDVFDLFFDVKGPKRFVRADFSKLPKEEKSRLRHKIMDVHDHMLDIFKAIPSSLILI